IGDHPPFAGAKRSMSVLRDLAAFACSASIKSLPEAERAIQRRHVADTFVAATAGALTSEGRALRSILPHMSVADAIGLQTAVIRHTEIDDIHTPSCVTPSSVTVPTALSLTRSRNEFDPDTVASAIWIGTELMTRLGMALDGARILYRGVWPTYFTAPFGAAAIAARIGKLNEDQTTHALSLALMLPAGRAGGFHGPLARTFGHAGDGGCERGARGGRRAPGCRRGPRSALRTLAARGTGPRSRSRRIDRGPWRDQHLYADDAQAVLLRQAGDLIGRST